MLNARVRATLWYEAVVADFHGAFSRVASLATFRSKWSAL